MGLYSCRFLPDGESEPCGKRFESDQARRTHEASHQLRTCRWCGEEFSKNGHTQHELSCKTKPHPLPLEAFRSMVADFVAHAHDIPTDAALVVSVHDGARIMTLGAAARLVADSDLALEPVSLLVIPTELLSAPEVAARWRRVDPDETHEELVAGPHDDAPIVVRRKKDTTTSPAMAGIDWTRIK